MNVSMYFVARETCADNSAHTAIIAVPTFPGVTSMRSLSLLDSVVSEGDEVAHMMWDSTCNLILTILKAPANSSSANGGLAPLSFARHEVSEYDGEIRPLPAVSFPPDMPSWQPSPHWLAGLSTGSDFAEDKFRKGDRVGPPNELNCPACVEHTLEVWSDGVGSASDAPPDARIVGRKSLAPGGVVFNVSAHGLNLASSLAFLPPNNSEYSAGGRGMLFGLGVCCESAPSCPPGCAGHAGALSLVAYSVGDADGPVLLFPIAHSAADDPIALSLGVAIDRKITYPAPSPARLTVLVAGRLHTYLIEQEGEAGHFVKLTPGAEVAAQPIAGEPWNTVWGYVRA